MSFSHPELRCVRYLGLKFLYHSYRGDFKKEMTDLDLPGSVAATKSQARPFNPPNDARVGLYQHPSFESAKDRGSNLPGKPLGFEQHS
jgi:hypothetical protein